MCIYKAPYWQNLVPKETGKVWLGELFLYFLPEHKSDGRQC